MVRAAADLQADVIDPPALPGDLMSLRQRVRLVVVLGSLIAVGPLTIDMYLPALPALTADLETTSTAVQLTLTGTLVGLALGQLVIGPIADAYGRRRPLLAGLALHVVASALCVVAPSIGVLGALRVVQGLGVAAATVVAMAVVRDLFSGTAFARLFSRLMLVMGLAPILAPTVGSAVLEATSWRGVFVVLGLFGVALMLTALFALRETLPPARRRRGGAVDTVRTYGALLRDRVFVGMVLVAGFAMAAVFSYVAGSSFVFQDQYGLDERQFGIAFGAGAVGLIAATQLNVRLLRRWTPQRVLVAALTGGTAAGALLVVFAATGFGGLATLLAALWLVLFSGGLAMPNASAVAMTRHGEAAGTAAALLGAVQFGTGALAAPLVGVLGNDGLGMATVVAGGMVAATLALLLVVRPHRIAEPEVAPAAVPVAA
ncbi:putative multidrug resistance transporter, Bcr/CflA family protein [Asanoa siamensis]|uniref:Multidrug resistance transporter, Bcr/CflA family protein n=2 Tax=Asanoa siamensis TaxID=926357 RepID=A0ABQ4D2D6_9ACTN|nr:putative multidrug resistance transporter, Bcr/CflA family protein [Asanoa siamensis]